MIQNILSLKELIHTHQRFIIVSHKSPDGDAVGSSVGWYYFLKSLGKEAFIVLPDMPSAVILPFLEGTNHCFYDSNKELAVEEIKAVEVLFCLDFNGPSRVGKEMQAFLEDYQGAKCMIDHHQDPDDFVSLVISDPKNSSTCQMIFECIEAMDQLEKIDLKIARALYLGMMTDTGSFRYPSVNAKTHEALAFFMHLGLKHYEIHEQINDANSIDQLKLRGFAIAEKLTIHPSLPLGFIVLTANELFKYNYRQGDTEGLVNVILSIEGIEMAVIIQEKSDGLRMSFRSKGAVYVNELAKTYFNGGGHKYAAGGMSNEDIENTVAKLLINAPKFFI